jgi:isopentenyl diphosphate isomerase/L-lactate dehydrogenase-like FMN-dependent dehydrogenase
MEAYVVIGIIVAIVVVKFVMDGNKKSTVKSKPVPSKPVQKKPTTAQLKKLTKNQLLDIADKHDIKGVKKSGAKAVVVSQIRDNWSEGDEFEEE